jgi:hypothetical protein
MKELMVAIAFSSIGLELFPLAFNLNRQAFILHPSAFIL